MTVLLFSYQMNLIERVIAALAPDGPLSNL